jgi:hypothetical protein
MTGSITGIYSPKKRYKKKIACLLTQKYPPRRWDFVKSSQAGQKAAWLPHIPCRGGSASAEEFGGMVFFP